MISCVQGYELKIKVSSIECKFVASDGLNKIVLDNVINDEGEFFIIADANTTKDWHSGRWAYQILGVNGIEEQDTLKILPNLEYSNDTTTSYWRKVLNAIDEKIAGRIDDVANEITVGDKKIRIYERRAVTEAS